MTEEWSVVFCFIICGATVAGSRTVRGEMTEETDSRRGQDFWGDQTRSPTVPSTPLS